MNYLSRKGGRRFTKNGRKFYVGNLDCRKIADENGNKYMLYEIMQDDKFEVMYDSLGWKMCKFKTISEAREYVDNWEFLLKAW